MALAALLGAVLLGVALVAAMQHGAAPPAGPLGEDPGVPNRLRFGVAIGQPFSYGLVVLRNRSRSEARITEVELVGTRGRIELVAAGVRPIPDGTGRGLVANDRVYPPIGLAGVLRAAVGARIAPESTERGSVRGTELLLGLLVRGPGSHGFEAVAVRYRHAGRDFRAVLPYGLTVCASARDAPCPMPG